MAFFRAYSFLHGDVKVRDQSFDLAKLELLPKDLHELDSMFSEVEVW
jgi:hypothetical protein